MTVTVKRLVNGEPEYRQVSDSDLTYWGYHGFKKCEDKPMEKKGRRRELETVTEEKEEE